MPLQNRVTPFGQIVASSARGTLMGNRGCLHDADRMLGRRRWTTRAWVTCVLSFRGRDRKPLMKPGHYTELFFLDEATALAAGHRPCAECRHADYRRFADCWAARSGGMDRRVRAAEMDRVIHAERIDRRRGKITFEATLSGLPDGAMVAIGGTALLKHRGKLLRWSFEGYVAPDLDAPDLDAPDLNAPDLNAPDLNALVTVLTPRPIIEVLRAGYRPAVHSSAEGADFRVGSSGTA